MGLRTRLAVGAATLAAVFVLGGSAFGAVEDATPLFREAPPPPGVPPLPESPRILRSRYVAVDFDVLGGIDARAASAPATVLLNLFPDTTFSAERDRAEATSSGGLIWTGHRRGVPDSTVTLVAEDGVLVGNVQADGRFYEVRYVGDGVHRVTETNPAAFGPD